MDTAFLTLRIQHTDIHIHNNRLDYNMHSTRFCFVKMSTVYHDMRINANSTDTVLRNRTIPIIQNTSLDSSTPYNYDNTPDLIIYLQPIQTQKLTGSSLVCRWRFWLPIPTLRRNAAFNWWIPLTAFTLDMRSWNTFSLYIVTRMSMLGPYSFLLQFNTYIGANTQSGTLKFLRMRVPHFYFHNRPPDRQTDESGIT